MLLIKLTLSMVGGIVMHQTRPLMARNLSNGWLELASYTLGSLSVLPFMVLIERKDLDGLSEPNKSIAAYLLAYLSFGFGTALGWFVDTALKR